MYLTYKNNVYYNNNILIEMSEIGTKNLDEIIDRFLKKIK